MLIDCPHCGGETGCICQWCDGNGCSFCHHTGQDACPTCEGQGTADVHQFLVWCRHATPDMIREAIDRLTSLDDQLDAVNEYLDAAIDWLPEDMRERYENIFGGSEQ